MYYAHINITTNEIIDITQCKYLNDDIKNIEVTQEVFDNAKKYIFINGEIILNPDYDNELLNQAKESKISKINESKEQAFKSGIIFKNEHFDCDDRAQDRTGNRLLLLQAMPVETLEWLDYNYKPVVLTSAEFQHLCAAIFERIQFIEFKTGELFDAVNAAQTLEELEAVEITYTADSESAEQEGQDNTTELPNESGVTNE